jgi:hypothetical protein
MRGVNKAMKRSISLVLAVVLAFCFCIVPVVADDEATATVTASLVGDTVPQAGEKFIISVDASNISTGAYWASQADFEWPAEVATLVNYAGTSVTPAKNPALSIGGVQNKFSTETYEGKYQVTTSIDTEKGTAAILLTAALDADDKSYESVTDYAMYKVAFVLNEGYTYDDFYFTFTKNYLWVNPSDMTDVITKDTGITVVNIEKPVSVSYESVAGQPGDGAGVYALPAEIKGEAKVTFDVAFNSPKDAMIGINNAANMTNNNYFSGSTVLVLVGGTTISSRGPSKVGIGTIDATGEYSVVETIDMAAQKWSVTVTDKATGEVVATATDVAFRTNVDVPESLDSLVLADNAGGIAGTVVVTNLAVEIISEPEVPTEVETEPETTPETEPETTPATEPETVPATEPETVPATEPETVPATEPETVPETEPETVPATEAPTIPEDALVAAAGQNEAGVYALENEIKTTGTVKFTVVPFAGPANTLVAIDSADSVVGSDYFGNSSVFFLFNNGKINYRKDGSNVPVSDNATFTDGVAYDFVVTIDVEAKTFDFVITAEDGTVVADVTGASFRNANVDSLDSIVLVNNNGKADSLYVTDLSVEVPDEPATEPTEPSEPETDPTEPTEPSEPETDPTETELPFVNANTTEVATPNGITVNVNFTTESEEFNGQTVIVLVTVLKDGKPFSVFGTTAAVEDGVVNATVNAATTDGGEYTVEAISILSSTTPFEAVSGTNMGTPIGRLNK